MTKFKYCVYPPGYKPFGEKRFREVGRLKEAVVLAASWGNGSHINRNREDSDNTGRRYWTDMVWKLDNGEWWVNYPHRRDRDQEYCLQGLPKDE